MSTFKWAQCPPELQLQIFRQLFRTTPVTIAPRVRMVVKSKAKDNLTLTRVALVCKDFRAIVKELFFEETMFFVDVVFEPHVNRSRAHARIDLATMHGYVHSSMKHMTLQVPKYYKWLSHRSNAIRTRQRMRWHEPVVECFEIYTQPKYVDLKTFAVAGYSFDAPSANKDIFKAILPRVEQINFEMCLLHEDAVVTKGLSHRISRESHAYEAIIRGNELLVYASKQAETAGILDDFKDRLFTKFPDLKAQLEEFKVVHEPLHCHNCGLEGRSKARGKTCGCDEAQQIAWEESLPESPEELRKALFVRVVSQLPKYRNG